jgi:hypothetical protein
LRVSQLTLFISVFVSLRNGITRENMPILLASTNNYLRSASDCEIEHPAHKLTKIFSQFMCWVDDFIDSLRSYKIAVF